MSQAAGADGGKVSSLPSSAERVDANTGAQAPRATALGLDPPRPTPVVEITITGSPIGQDYCHQTRRRLAGLRAVHPGRGCLPRDPAGTAQCLLPLTGGVRHPGLRGTAAAGGRPQHPGHRGLGQGVALPQPARRRAAAGARAKRPGAAPASTRVGKSLPTHLEAVSREGRLARRQGVGTWHWRRLSSGESGANGAGASFVSVR
jgi:hypothetical protein